MGKDAIGKGHNDAIGKGHNDAIGEGHRIIGCVSRGRQDNGRLVQRRRGGWFWRGEGTHIFITHTINS